MAALIGVGIWSQYFLETEKPAEQGKVTAPSAQEAPKTGTQNARPPAQTPPAQSAQPAQNQAPKQEPAKPADPNQKILEGRAHIDRSGGAAKTMKLTVYYLDGLKNADTLQPVEILVPETDVRIRNTVEHLLNPPGDLQLFSPFPAGTKVRSVNNVQGALTVDMSAELDTVQGSASANAIQMALVYSLTEIPGVKSVQVWTLGRPASLHGIVWNKPLSRADFEGRNLFKVEPVIKYR